MPEPIWTGVHGGPAIEVARIHFGRTPSVLERLDRRSVNTLYRFKADGNTYILKRLGRAVAAGWLAFQSQAVERVHERGVPVTPFVPSVRGENTVCHAGSAWQLTPYRPGRPFVDGRADELTRVARCVSLVHSVPVDGLDIAAANPIRDVETWLDSGRDELARLSAAARVAGVAEADLASLAREFERTLDRALGELDAATYAALPRTLTHGELTGSNILVDPATQEVVALLDWDGVAVRPRAYDLARGALFLARQRRDGFAVHDELVVSFLRTGSQPTPLATEEIDAIIPILELFLLPTAGYVSDLARHAPASLDWFLRWSAEGAGHVRSVMVPALDTFRRSGFE